MKICDNLDTPIPGHLYMHIDPNDQYDGYIYIANTVNTLTRLDNGNIWVKDKGFGDYLMSKGYWKDVTDQYRLVKIP